MSFDSQKIEEFSGVWVLCEQRDGALSDTGFELLSEGRRLADEIGTELTGVVLGGPDIADTATQIMEYGTDRIIVCRSPKLGVYMTEPYTTVLCDLIRQRKPEIMLFGATNLGRDLAPRIAARIHTGLTADCTHLDIDMEKYTAFLKANSTVDFSKIKLDETNRSLKMTRPAFGGHLMATIVCPRFRPCLATVRPGVMKRAESPCVRPNCQVELIHPELRNDPTCQVVETVKELRQTADLLHAEVIVSIGRGASDDFPRAKALAQALADALGGGVVGCSRAVAESGAMDESCQVGQTGKTVRPKIYVALGISGAIQHAAGMKDSDVIIAINKDANAPIFHIADYGICGDLFEAADQMIRLLTA